MFKNQAEWMFPRGAQAPSGVLAPAAFEQNSDTDLGLKAIVY